MIQKEKRKNDSEVVGGAYVPPIFINGGEAMGKTKADLEKEVADLKIEIVRLRYENDRLRGVIAETEQKCRAKAEEIKNLSSVFMETFVNAENMIREASGGIKAARKEIHDFVVVEKADRPRKKTGPKSIVTPEDAAYIHELLSSGSSLQAIADRLTADYTSDDGEVQKHFSKSLIQKVSKQEPPKGKWYSGSDGNKVYYDNFREALRSGKDIHFEAKTEV